MKSKLAISTIVIALVAILFSFTSTNKQSKIKGTAETKNQNEPIGGFVSESKF